MEMKTTMMTKVLAIFVATLFALAAVPYGFAGDKDKAAKDDQGKNLGKHDNQGKNLEAKDLKEIEEEPEEELEIEDDLVEDMGLMGVMPKL
jgi:Spy/CpxP family protein refolding chaperone